MTSPSECGRPSDDDEPFSPGRLRAPARHRRPRGSLAARRSGPYPRPRLWRNHRVRRSSGRPRRGRPGRRAHRRASRQDDWIDAGLGRRLPASRWPPRPAHNDRLPRPAHAANDPDAGHRHDHLVEGPADRSTARRNLRRARDHALPERPGHLLHRAHHRAAHQATGVGACSHRHPGPPRHYLELPSSPPRPADRPVHRDRGRHLVRARGRTHAPRGRARGRRVPRTRGQPRRAPRPRRGHADRPGPRGRRPPHARRRHGFAPHGRARLRRAAAQPPGIPLTGHAVPLPEHDRQGHRAPDGRRAARGRQAPPRDPRLLRRDGHPDRHERQRVWIPPRRNLLLRDSRARRRPGLERDRAHRGLLGELGSHRRRGAFPGVHLRSGQPAR